METNKKYVPMRKIKVISALLTFSIMALIFFFSSQNSSDSRQLSSDLTIRILDVISVIKPISYSAKLVIISNSSFIVRKTAHFVIYMALGASSVITAKLFINKSLRYNAVYAEIFCILYAMSDELHQYFVIGRAARIGDVFIDSLGAVFGIAVILVIRSTKKKRLGPAREAGII